MNEHGNTALHEAAWRGFSQTVKLLCDQKAKIKQNKAGFSPLHLSCQAGHNQSTRELLLHRADTEVQNTYGDSPLHTAVRYGHAGVARILLSARACPHPVNKNGDTPLHISCAMSHRKLTRILLESGSKTEIVNNQGERPIDISRRKKYDSITNLLLSPPPVLSLFNRDFMRESKREKPTEHTHTVGWSPYGCHYHPDSCFQGKEELKVENLPTEPLQNGELYYIDLGGNIRKGPMGKHGRCFCFKERGALELEELNQKLSKLEFNEEVQDGLMAWVEEYRDFKKDLRKSRRKRRTLEKVGYLIDSANQLLGCKNDDVDSGI
ncbi:unnamed protein product [Allacma fusca]|uniref:Uncharacterized protein n=1 Tax=Allacma fusca TaxID=39272 RepID=A0A8J2JPT2_9HEXA|nr:unnamed protein product [Allacma fusca]